MNAYFLCGPTSVGKTHLAHRIALLHGYDIISADAMLVYRGLDIGTAKPTRRELSEVRYFGVDLASPAQSFSVADYLAALSRQLDSAYPAPRQPLLVTGGSGLYLKALLYGLDDAPAPDPERRRIFEELARSGGAAALREELRRCGPAWLASLPDPENPRRLIRALEWVAGGYTEPPRSWRSRPTAPALAGLCMTPRLLSERITVRARMMLDSGLWSEAAALQAAGGLGRTARQAIGYAEAFAYLRGDLSEAEALDGIILRTRHLAKRQMTWLRGQLPVEWVSLDSPRPIEDIISDIGAVWFKNGVCRLSL